MLAEMVPLADTVFPAYRFLDMSCQLPGTATMGTMNQARKVAKAKVWQNMK
jgi:hypothetical protein